MSFFLLMALYGILAIVLESTWLSNLPTSMLRFDFIIVAVAALSFYREAWRAIPVIVFFGVITDVASGGPFGMSILSYLIIYGCVRMVLAKISFQAGAALIFWIAMISVLDKLVSAVFMMAVTGRIVFAEVIIQAAPAQAILDAAIAIFLIPFIKWYWDLSWEKITRPKGLVMK
ncbi:MAG: rod shape-determining protein MreD [Deltaproteobacteria bacterium]|jgi:rod shape-determining protein MreD|nr:rod shape-determining protein MreD [Deltaproteobacteria bacterium]